MTENTRQGRKKKATEKVENQREYFQGEKQITDLIPREKRGRQA